jgi:hypothetical protein
LPHQPARGGRTRAEALASARPAYWPASRTRAPPRLPGPASLSGKRAGALASGGDSLRRRRRALALSLRTSSSGSGRAGAPENLLILHGVSRRMPPTPLAARRTSTPPNPGPRPRWRGSHRLAPQHAAAGLGIGRPTPMAPVSWRCVWACWLASERPGVVRIVSVRAVDGMRPPGSRQGRERPPRTHGHATRWAASPKTWTGGHTFWLEGTRGPPSLDSDEQPPPCPDAACRLRSVLGSGGSSHRQRRQGAGARPALDQHSTSTRPGLDLGSTCGHRLPIKQVRQFPA